MFDLEQSRSGVREHILNQLRVVGIVFDEQNLYARRLCVACPSVHLLWFGDGHRVLLDFTLILFERKSSWTIKTGKWAGTLTSEVRGVRCEVSGNGKRFAAAPPGTSDLTPQLR